MTTQIFLKKTRLLPIVFLLCQFNSSSAQEPENVIRNVFSGAEKIGLAYLKPATIAVSSALATGWSNSAKVLNPWQIEVRLGGNMVWIAQSDRQFDLRNINLPANFETENPDYWYPTVFGSTVQNNSRLLIKDNDNKQLTRFRMPPGLGISKAYIPQLQIGTGLPYKSALYVRFTPSVKIRNYGRGSFVGFALQKEVFNAKLKKQRELTASLLLGFNKLGYNYTLTDQRLIVENPDTSKANYAGQRVKDHINIWNLDAMLSYRIPFQSHAINSCFNFNKRAYQPLETYFEPFISVGFIQSNNVFNAYGTYNIKTDYDSVTGQAIYTDVNGQDYAKQMRSTLLQTAQGTLGFTLNIGFFRLFGSYTMGSYSLLNAGLGFKFYAYKAKHNELTGF